MVFLGPGPGVEHGHHPQLTACVFAVKAEPGQGRHRGIKEGAI